MKKKHSNDDDSKFLSIEDICSSMGVCVNTPSWPDKFGQSIITYLHNKGERPIRTLSLFSGAGGLDIGFSDAGFEIVSSVEIEKMFCDTLQYNSGDGKYFPAAKVNCIDIREFSADNLGHIDWIIGGPPCQTFSAAGRRVSGVLGTNDARGTLFKEYVRLLKQVQPSGFLFENVFGIVGAQNGEPWREIQQSFKDAGYQLYFRILDAADYGVPQHRERLLIVGLKEGSFFFPRPTHGPDSRHNTPFYSAGTALKGTETEEDINNCIIKGRYQKLLQGIPPGLNYSFYTEEMGHPTPLFAWRSKFSDFMYKADPAQPVRTITATGRQYTGPLHWDNRYFTCEEYKRLQTFPDSYRILGVKPTVLKQIGNSVPPQLARIMALAIRHQVFGTVLPFEMETIDDSFEMSYKTRKRELSKKYRDEAKKIIASLNIERGSIISVEEYYLSFSEKFDYITSNDHGTFKVISSWNEEKLAIDVVEQASSAKKKCSIVIKPKTEWTLPVNEIILSSTGTEWGAMCASWRVLDHEVIIHNLKADIIQLNGYYLYESELVCEFTHDKIKNQNVIDSITLGKCTQKIVSTSDLSKLWQIPESEVPMMAAYIKSLGYDIRNSNTNPQMKKGEWIIPYKFPSLVSQSIQMYKQL